ncbi:hypothetical protein M0R45_005516 [Rubus argutus]|uniref:Uncharacterized protein n=1 Tax=Rubus argutus TaxID=59490 RepID=A0AAW1YMN0_RUBAR
MADEDITAATTQPPASWAVAHLLPSSSVFLKKHHLQHTSVHSTTLQSQPLPLHGAPLLQSTQQLQITISVTCTMVSRTTMCTHHGHSMPCIPSQYRTATAEPVLHPSSSASNPEPKTAVNYKLKFRLDHRPVPFTFLIPAPIWA